MGRFKNNSPKIQPQDQTSIEGPYRSSPRSSSGGRYHKVMTLLVYGLCLSSACNKKKIKIKLEKKLRKPNFLVKITV